MDAVDAVYLFAIYGFVMVMWHLTVVLKRLAWQSLPPSSGSDSLKITTRSRMMKTAKQQKLCFDEVILTRAGTAHVLADCNGLRISDKESNVAYQMCKICKLQIKQRSD
jgi:hypothetical protein